MNKSLQIFVFLTSWVFMCTNLSKIFPNNFWLGCTHHETVNVSMLLALRGGSGFGRQRRSGRFDPLHSSDQQSRRERFISAMASERTKSSTDSDESSEDETPVSFLLCCIPPADTLVILLFLTQSHAAFRGRLDERRLERAQWIIATDGASGAHGVSIFPSSLTLVTFSRPVQP